MAWSELERRLAIHLSGDEVAIAGATSYYVDLRRSRRHEFCSPTLPFLPAVSDARVEDVRTKAHRLRFSHVRPCRLLFSHVRPCRVFEKSANEHLIACRDSASPPTRVPPAALGPPGGLPCQSPR